MSLKLFRSTGHASILSPGETIVAMHTGWMVAAVSCWIGLACNVALWRALGLAATPEGAGRSLAWALAASVFAAAACALVLSLLGWRRTLKPAAVLLLALAALGAAGIWSRQLPFDATAWTGGLRGLLPAGLSWLRWQTWALLAVLLLPAVRWVTKTPVRRMTGPRQLSANLTGMGVGFAALLVSGFVLLRGTLA